MSADNSQPSSNGNQMDMTLFWGCFIALVTCAFGFIVRTQIVGEWQTEFKLSETEKGNILGVGFWPFAFSIFIFSLIIDRIGYKTAAMIGWVFHALSTVILVTAKDYNTLYWGTFIFALSNGTVEAYINPVVAAAKSKEKVKWLNILHAGWPGGMVVAGLIALSMGDAPWRYKVALTFIPTIIYGFMLFKKTFPVSERVAAGISYRDMLKDFGGAGMFVSIYLIALQVLDVAKYQGDNFQTALWASLIVAVLFGFYVKGFGNPVFVILALVMMPLATTELGIDSWVTELMKPEMGKYASLILIYTAGIMTVLRFFAGPVLALFKNNPFNLLAVSAALAIVGLLTLSTATGLTILIAATLYGMGKTFFWPTMLAAVNEQCPKGGAMSLNCIGGVGMLSLSIGSLFLGSIQDKSIVSDLQAHDTKSQTQLVQSYTVEKDSVLGKYKALDADKTAKASDETKKVIEGVQASAKKNALKTAAIFPVIMVVVYLLFIFYFKSRGGYKPVELSSGGGH